MEDLEDRYLRISSELDALKAKYEREISLNRDLQKMLDKNSTGNLKLQQQYET